MNGYLIALCGAVLFGFIVGASLGAILVRRAITLNLRRLADSPALKTFNSQARLLNLSAHQVARMAIREAASIAAGEEQGK